MTEVKMSAMEAVIMAKLKQRAAERGVTLASIPSAIVRQKIMPMVETADHKAAFQSNRLWLDMSTHFKPRTLELKGDTLNDWLRKMSRRMDERTTGPRQYVASVAETVTELNIEIDDDMYNVPVVWDQPEFQTDLALEYFRPFVLLGYFPRVQTLTITMQRGRDPQAHEWTVFTNLASASLLKLPQLRHLTWDAYGDFNLTVNETQMNRILGYAGVADNLKHLETLAIHGPCLGKDAGKTLAAVLPKTLHRLRVDRVRVTPEMLQLLAERCPALTQLVLTGSSLACEPGQWGKLMGKHSWQHLSTTVLMNEDDLDTIGSGGNLTVLKIRWHENGALAETKRALYRLLYRSPKLESLIVRCEHLEAEFHKELEDAIRKVAAECCPHLRIVRVGAPT